MNSRAIRPSGQHGATAPPGPAPNRPPPRSRSPVPRGGTGSTRGRGDGWSALCDEPRQITLRQGSTVRHSRWTAHGWVAALSTASGSGHRDSKLTCLIAVTHPMERDLRAAALFDMTGKRPTCVTAVLAITAAWPPLLSYYSPLLFDNSKSGFKPLRTKEKMARKSPT